MTQPKTLHPVEPGAASIQVSLRDGNIKVLHGEDDTLLAYLDNAPAGTWDKLWKYFEKLGFNRLYR